MRQVTLAATQMACTDDEAANLDRAEGLVRDAAAQGAQLVLIQELFAGPYFCKEQDPAQLSRALPLASHPVLARFQALARELGVVLPLSLFERAGQAHFNSLITVDADGSVVGTYRKAHIPDGPGYQEKFYFSPGDSGFHPVETAVGRLGPLICWDQWFPEAARALVLRGAEILLYPTAIGSEPPDPTYDSRGHWRRVMQGHAAANMVPVVASNRIGSERQGATAVTFYGHSFITDQTGALLAAADHGNEAVLIAHVDLDAISAQRAAWGLFRDRRPDLYAPLASMDGQTRRPA